VILRRRIERELTLSERDGDGQLRLGFAEIDEAREVFEPKSGSWRPAAVWQIADIMRYGQETRGFAAATGG